MAMTLRLDPQLDAELHVSAEEDRRSVHQTVVLAIETYLALRETAEVKADPDALRALAEARQAIQDGDVVYGTGAVRDLLRGRQAS
jgi:predicted transcriptional regulator